MSLSQALLSSSSGLRVAQAGLSLIASNVANAETAGYVRKTLSQLATAGTGAGAGVRVAEITRELDQYMQRQLRVETAGGSYADLRATFYDRMQVLFGEPGADGTLEASLNDLFVSLQALSTSPESYSARGTVLQAAAVLAQQLNAMSNGIQALRSDAEYGLADSIAVANEAMGRIASINQQLAASPLQDAAAAVLRDQRDNYIDRLAELMDIRVIEADNNQLTVFTNSGVQLVGAKAARLEFDPQGTMTANTEWSADPAERAVGTVMLISPSGDSMDLLANRSIRSGRIAAYVEMRDQVLVEAQAQLDAIAAGMSQALSDRTIAGTAASAGPLNGFEADLAGLLDGNSVSVSYTDVASGAQRTVTLVRVSAAAALPLGDGATVDPNDQVFGIDFSGGMASAVTQIAAALGPQFTVSNPSGNVLRILDDGGVGVAMDALSVTKTVTGFATGGAELPFFLDGATPYSGAVSDDGYQMTGIAARLTVNAALIADPAKLIAYSTTPPAAAGDTTRPDFILAQLSQATLTFPAHTGIGSASSPFRGSLSAFTRQVISRQGEAASAADYLKQGQDVVVNALAQRMSDASGVNIDQEMAHLLQLQSAYSANARVMSVVKEMMDLLSRI